MRFTYICNELQCDFLAWCLYKLEIGRMSMKLLVKSIIPIFVILFHNMPRNLLEGQFFDKAACQDFKTKKTC